jgi:hypothetical protein
MGKTILEGVWPKIARRMVESKRMDEPLEKPALA